MVKYREQRGSLAESMETVVEINDLNELVEHLRKTKPHLDLDAQIQVKKYGDFDARINWHTHIVLVGGIPAGFTDGPLTQ